MREECSKIGLEPDIIFEEVSQMEWVKRLNESIRYIEEHLTGEMIMGSLEK